MKKSKRKKKKIKKLSAGSVSSRDISHEVTTTAKESLVLPDTHTDGTRGLRVENIAASPGVISESNAMRAEKLRHTKVAVRVKIPPSPHYLARQQRVNGLLEENTSVPKATQHSLVDFFRGYSRMILPMLGDALNFVHSSLFTVLRDIIRCTALLGVDDILVVATT